ncbi:hypothetical protein [Streptomyces mexicanus]|uniref:hypothetical protein n=1 Tax=Streptomyces mexicanus TaxID=178566 RepID=UPI00364673D9
MSVRFVGGPLGGRELSIPGPWAGGWLTAGDPVHHDPVARHVAQVDLAARRKRKR